MRAFGWLDRLTLRLFLAQGADVVTFLCFYLLVGPFLYQYNAVASTQLQSVTGVLDEFDTMTDTVYQLLPRTAADIVE